MARKYRVFLLLVVCAWSTAAVGQMVNASFEDGAAFSSTGWMTDSWDGFSQVHEGAPGWGEWSASTPAYTSGLPGTGFHQELPWLHEGDIITLSAWLKCPQQYFLCGGLYINSCPPIGFISVEPQWVFLTVTDTVSPCAPPFNEPFALRFGTSAPGPVNSNPRPCYLDGVSIEVVGHVGIAQPQREAHSFYFDESTEQLIFNGMQPGIEALIMDASGRRLLESTTTESVLRIDMKGHTAGVYVARVRIGLDVHVQRFVKP